LSLVSFFGEKLAAAPFRTFATISDQKADITAGPASSFPRQFATAPMMICDPD
jgi:hypothetical protein